MTTAYQPDPPQSMDAILDVTSYIGAGGLTEEAAMRLLYPNAAAGIASDNWAGHLRLFGPSVVEPGTMVYNLNAEHGAPALQFPDGGPKLFDNAHLYQGRVI